MSSAPLPVREGVAPSRVHLPPGPWPTLFDFLCERFRFLTPEVLRGRMQRGDIVDEAGVAQRPETPYSPGRWLWYYREVPDEPLIPLPLTILHQDEYIVVVDKPHFLPSIPGGRHLRETALTRLRQCLQQPLLTPVHRLDRDTAGLMLFCLDPARRGAYQGLFQSRQVHKEYLAVAPRRATLHLPLVYRSRLEPAASHFLMQEQPGEPNSETVIETLETRDDLALYRLQPTTGRKHQLRVHMNALGIPICNDPFYPCWVGKDEPDDWERPLQLLAKVLEFTDPVSGRTRRFESRLQLSAWHQCNGALNYAQEHPCP